MELAATKYYISKQLVQLLNHDQVPVGDLGTFPGISRSLAADYPKYFKIPKLPDRWMIH